MKSNKKESQAYHAPQVMDYGNVKQITMRVGKNGRNDSGSWPRNKTH
jgi:hypothetical protein